MGDIERFPTEAKVGDGTPGPGRRPGQQNKLTRLLKEAVLQAAENVGKLEYKVAKNGKRTIRATRKGGLTAYLESMAVNEPRTFGTLLAKVIPLQVKGSFDVGAKDSLKALLEKVNGQTRSR